MAPFTACGEPAGLVEIAHLHGFVTVALHGPDLKDVARSSRNHRDRDRRARFVIDLSHSDLAAEYALDHRDLPFECSTRRKLRQMQTTDCKVPSADRQRERVGPG